MTDPYVRHFDFPDNKNVTAVVLDKVDFDAVCDELFEILESWGQPAQQVIEAIKEAENIPAMVRGTKTQKFFDRWNVKTSMLSVIVRGAGMRVLMRKCLGGDTPTKSRPEPSNN